MNIPDIFGENVFNEAIMREKLPEEVYESLKTTIEIGDTLDLSVANEVARAMKEWAVSKGATHFTHWFQPMTGITAEKHDSFIAPVKEGAVIMEFSGKELVLGEPDASSFPNGGIRATFEARGYTAWDPTSYAFIKDGTLYIPSVFCSYGGEALDKKTPLLRSMETLNVQALRILRLFGNNEAKRVIATAGAEQEYFLIDRATYEKRKDLKFTGRTLFGAKAPKGQELDDHYFGTIKPRVVEYMKDLDNELWKLGVLAKTEHNEAAPAQHELAPIYTNANLATDHNQLTMDMMKKVAIRHNLVCLLHEKPFENVNGSGKHNNWSMSTDLGENLFSPGKNPAENMQFLLFFVAVVKAVDEYQDLLRISVASAGNDHRLGANEAPPAIVSMYVGDEMQSILDAIERGAIYHGNGKIKMKLGVNVLPTVSKDTTDRNRTSPFAFTGNKFEFRMLGSSFSIGGPNIILNTIVAEELEQFANRLENAKDFTKELADLLASTVKEHKRIIFNGNNYTAEWVEEAERRGLSCYRTTADALPHFSEKRFINLFQRHGVFSEVEILSRTEILLENYVKVLNIEAATMIEMARREIYPAVSDYVASLSLSLNAKTSSLPQLNVEEDKRVITVLSDNNQKLLTEAGKLERLLERSKTFSDIQERAEFFANEIIVQMRLLRNCADEMETYTDSKYWPMPSYGDILFGV